MPCVAADEKPTAKHPNVLLLAIDDLPAEGLQMADHVQWRLNLIITKGRMTISTRCEN